MAIHKTLDIDGAPADGYVVPLGTCNLVFICKGNSLLACGAVDIEALNAFHVPAASMSGVATLDDLLAGEVRKVNAAAAALGVAAGQTGREALKKLG